MASVMKRENASVIKKGCQENKLEPGRARTAMKTVKSTQSRKIKCFYGKMGGKPAAPKEPTELKGATCFFFPLLDDFGREDQHEID